MRKQTRWIIGAVLGLVAIYLASGSLLFEPVKPVYAQTGCTGGGVVSILSVSPTSIYNSGPSAFTVVGSGFATDGTASVTLVGFGALTVTSPTATMLTTTIPPGAPGTPGGSRYDVLVSNNNSPTDCDVLTGGLTIYMVPVGTSTPVPTAVPTNFMRPLVTVLSYGASSRVLYPGQEIDFEITLQNNGPIVARNVVVEFSGTDLLPRETGGLRTPGDIAGGGGTVRFFQPLRVSSNLGGYQAVINIKISYTDEYGARYSDGSTLSFDAGQYAKATATLSLSPQIILSSYQTTPAILSPGTIFTLELSLANVSGKMAHQVLAELNTSGSSGTGSSASTAPVAPQNSSNMRYIDEMQPGQQVPLSFDMAVTGDASSSLANLSLAISYTDDSNQQHSQTEIISLRIKTKALLFVHFYNPMPDLMTVGDTIDLPIEVINIGANDLNVSMVEVTSDQMSITGGSTYFGPLSGGTSGTLLAQAQLTRAGAATVTVTVHYLDDFQQQQVITQDMSFEVEAVVATPTSGTGTPGGTGAETPGGEFGGLTIGQRILRMILGFFGIATQSAGGGGSSQQQFFGGTNGSSVTPQPSGGNTP